MEDKLTCEDLRGMVTKLKELAEDRNRVHYTLKRNLGNIAEIPSKEFSNHIKELLEMIEGDFANYGCTEFTITTNEFDSERKKLKELL